MSFLRNRSTSTVNTRAEGEQMNEDMPAAAVRLEKKAREAGWTVEIVPAPTSVALRMRRGKERLVALWVGGKFDGAWQGWKPELPHGGVSPRRLSSRELTAVVTG